MMSLHLGNMVYSSLFTIPWDHSFLLPVMLLSSILTLVFLSLLSDFGLLFFNAIITMIMTCCFSCESDLSLAVKPQMNSTTSSVSSSSSSLSPLKKLNYSNSSSGFNTISGKPTPHIVNPSFKDDVDVSKVNSIIDFSKSRQTVKRETRRRRRVCET